jgi:hemoglobin/transferrin/lactoferrin receptor protein
MPSTSHRTPLFPGATLHLAPLALALSLALPGVARAQPAPAGTATPEQPALKPVTVTATRTERAADEVPATVGITSREAIAERGARDLKDLFDDDVDLSMRAAATRFTAAGSSTGRAGNEGLNIRGLEGNQVLMLVDGIRVPGAFSFGPFATGRADYLDVDTLASAEVLRGPSSSQYGSDGLAGALSLRTLRADDLLTAGKSRAGFVKFGAHSVDASGHVTAALALGGEQLRGLLLLTHREGHETDNQGDNDSRHSERTTPNPLDHQATSLLGGLTWRRDARHAFDATLEARRREQRVNVLSANAQTPQLPSMSNPFANQTVSLVADDTLQRQRLSLAHRFDDPSGTWLSQSHTQLYAQRATVNQLSAEDRFYSPDRTRDNTYEERIVGLSALGATVLRGALPQRLAYGVDLSETRIAAERNGTVPPFGEVFPAKPFPDTRHRQAGAFVQSEIDTDSLTLIPALRFDKFSLVPTSTAGFSGTAVSLGDQAVTPRLGAIWRVTPGFAPYAQWALGFRAPQADQVNNGFSNLASGYTSIGNPDLKPERARSVELGVRGALDGMSWQVAFYDNRYRDFISQQFVGGSFSPGDPAVFQYVNLASARIRGGELRMEWRPAAGWTGQFALARAQGESEADGVRTPLDTVNPLRMRLAMRHEAAAWSATAQWQHADAKQARAASSSTAFLPPNSDVLDLLATWRLNATWSLRGALLNLFDATYWRWSDVRGVSALARDGAGVNPALTSYTAPGRSVQVSLRAEF